MSGNNIRPNFPMQNINLMGLGNQMNLQNFNFQNQGMINPIMGNIQMQGNSY